MTTKCYITSYYDVDFALVVCDLIMNFDCKIDAKQLNETDVEVYIVCKDEVVCKVEERLANVV